MWLVVGPAYYKGEGQMAGVLHPVPSITLPVSCDCNNEGEKR